MHIVYEILNTLNVFFIVLRIWSALHQQPERVRLQPTNHRISESVVHDLNPSFISCFETFLYGKLTPLYVSLFLRCVCVALVRKDRQSVVFRLYVVQRDRDLRVVWYCPNRSGERS